MKTVKENNVAKKGDCGKKPRVGKVGDPKPGRGRSKRRSGKNGR